MNPFTINDFHEAKSVTKITMLTAYDYSTARILDEAGVDCILVGDSLGMVFQGNPSTLKVTVDQMVYHTKAVSRGVKHAFIVADMPFMSYHVSTEEAVRNAGRLIQEGNANAVKLEGGISMVPTIKAIVHAQIPVMGHIGLTPQSINALGGFKVQGKEAETAKKLIDSALALEEAGVFALVLEGIPEKLAALITKKLTIPTIGIGASAACDGQVLVINDLLGLFKNFTPKFVKQYADLGSIMDSSIKHYINDVKNGLFPEMKHTFSLKDDILEKLY